MPGLGDITTQFLKQELGVEVDESHVVLAKHSVLGTPAETIMEIFACTREELSALESSETYQFVRKYVAAQYAKQELEQGEGWDTLESQSLNRLIERMKTERDPDFLLRVAAVANKAERRRSRTNRPAVLDPSRAGRTVITLTERLTQRLTAQGGKVLEAERELSISDGSMANPGFEEVSQLLNMTTRPVLPLNVDIQTRAAEPTDEELLAELTRRSK